MAKSKHRKFNADKFVDVFAEHPQLLRDFVRCYDGALFQNEEDFNLDAFKELAAEAVSRDPNLVEHLYRAYDISKDPYGHEALCAVIRGKGWTVDNELPVECLGIWLHNHDQDTFNFAYDRMNFNNLEKVTMYRVEPPEVFNATDENLTAFEDALKEVFQNDNGSSNVLARKYTKNDCLNIIIYHEKRTQAQLIFKGRENAVGPLMLRPAKQDFVSFNHVTGELQVDASYTKEKAALRKAFASKFLQDEELFETAEAQRVLDLNIISDVDFSMPVSDPEH